MAVMRPKGRRHAAAALLLMASFTSASAANKIPLPPKRPPDLTPAPIETPDTTIEMPVAPKLVTPVKPALSSLSREDLLKEVNTALSSLTQFSARFAQTDASGQTLTGRLTVLKPGRLRFDYNPPSALKIIADGNLVAVIDQKLNTQDVYSIGLTPLKFLLSRSIDLAREFKILDARVEPDRVVIEMEDSTTFGGASQLEIGLDPKTLLLRNWTVTDPQGYPVSVVLSQIDTKHEPDGMLFVIPQRPGSGKNAQ